MERSQDRADPGPPGTTDAPLHAARKVSCSTSSAPSGSRTWRVMNREHGGRHARAMNRSKAPRSPPAARSQQRLVPPFPRRTHPSCGTGGGRGPSAALQRTGVHPQEGCRGGSFPGGRWRWDQPQVPPGGLRSDEGRLSTATPATTRITRSAVPSFLGSSLSMIHLRRFRMGERRMPTPHTMETRNRGKDSPPPIPLPLHPGVGGPLEPPGHLRTIPIRWYTGSTNSRRPPPAGRTRPPPADSRALPGGR